MYEGGVDNSRRCHAFVYDRIGGYNPHRLYNLLFWRYGGLH